MFAHASPINTIGLFKDRDVTQKINGSLKCTARDNRSRLLLEARHELPVPWIKRLHRARSSSQDIFQIMTKRNWSVVHGTYEYTQPVTLVPDPLESK